MLAKGIGAPGRSHVDLPFFGVHGRDVFSTQPLGRRNPIRHELPGSRGRSMVFGGTAAGLPSGYSGISHIHFHGDRRESGSSRYRPRGESQAKSVGPPLDEVPLADLVRGPPDPPLVFGSFDIQEFHLRRLFAGPDNSDFFSSNKHTRTLAGSVASNLRPSFSSKPLASALVGLYRLWHGTFHLPGAGRLVQGAAQVIPALQNFPLCLPAGNTIHVDFRDVTAFCWINHFLGDAFEEQGLIEAIGRRPKARGVCWDVGANGGLLSHVLARAVHPRQIEFFEPQPFLFQMARDATAGLGFVRGHHCALSDHAGVARFLLLKGESTKARILPESLSGPSVELQIESGDFLVEQGRALPPDLIKIDTEGHEKEVLAGLVNTVRQRQPDIFFEHLGLTDPEIMAMRPEGYDHFTLRDEDGGLVPGLNRDVGHNSAFLAAGSA